MDKAILKNALKFFDSLGKIKSRSMFGGFGIFCNDTMFALVVNGSLHLRAGKQNEREFKALKMLPYTYTKRNFPVVTKYYEIPDNWWKQPKMLMDHVNQAISIASNDQLEKKSSIPTRIKDLPNLRLTTERLLRKAGIGSIKQLQEAGPIVAYQALQKTHNDSLSIDMLWALEGALDGKHWSVVTPQRRHELLENLHP